jgi:hypothetical protein
MVRQNKDAKNDRESNNVHQEDDAMIFDIIARKLSSRYAVCDSIFEIEKEGYVHDFPQTIAKLTKQDQEKILLLETIDLTLLPASTRLLSSILARIEMCVESPELFSAELPQRYPRGLLHRNPNALLELQRLQCNVAIGLEGNLDERKGSLDPDTYAIEVLRAARATIGITKRFHETLAALTKEYLAIDSLFIQGIIASAEGSIPPSPKLFDSLHMLFVIEKSTS